MPEFAMDYKDWIIVAATLLGPILAVQAQKAVESFRERRSRKARVFSQLMATRAARVSPEHVQALNMIDIVFFGDRTVGVRHRSKSEQAVLDSWREYHDHLGVKAEGEGLRLWNVRSDELFTNLCTQWHKTSATALIACNSSAAPIRPWPTVTLRQSRPLSGVQP